MRGGGVPRNGGRSGRLLGNDGRGRGLPNSGDRDVMLRRNIFRRLISVARGLFGASPPDGRAPRAAQGLAGGAGPVGGSVVRRGGMKPRALRGRRAGRGARLRGHRRGFLRAARPTRRGRGRGARFRGRARGARRGARRDRGLGQQADAGRRLPVHARESPRRVREGRESTSRAGHARGRRRRDRAGRARSARRAPQGGARQARRSGVRGRRTRRGKRKIRSL